MAARNDIAPEDRLKMCKEATALVSRPEEKKLLLAALGSIASLEAVDIITSYLADASTRDEAATAALGLAERLMAGRTPNKQTAAKLVAPLEKVAAATADNADLAKRANAALQKAKNAAK